MENKTEDNIKENIEDVQDIAEDSAIDKQEAVAEEKLSVEEKLTKENEEWNNKYLRLMADFENYKRNAIKDKMEMSKTATKDLMLTVVSLLDDFDRSLANMDQSEDVSAVKEGVELIHKKFMDTLGAKGLKPMDAKAQEFNADFHEAIAKIPAPTKEMKGKNIDEVEKGYLLNDVIIRFAKVVVGE